MSDFQLGWCQITNGRFVEPLWFTPKGRTFATLGDAIKVADRHNSEFKTIEHCVVDNENEVVWRRPGTKIPDVAMIAKPHPANDKEKA